jgi:uncharacterized membrane protein YfcA
MYVAVPISLIGTSFSSVGAFAGYLMNGYLPDLWLMISIIIGGFAGGMLGSRAQKLFSGPEAFQRKDLEDRAGYYTVLPVFPLFQN